VLLQLLPEPRAQRRQAPLQPAAVAVSSRRLQRLDQQLQSLQQHGVLSAAAATAVRGGSSTAAVSSGIITSVACLRRQLRVHIREHVACQLLQHSSRCLHRLLARVRHSAVWLCICCCSICIAGRHSSELLATGGEAAAQGRLQLRQLPHQLHRSNSRAAAAQ
jgi:hypothetical protein